LCGAHHDAIHRGALRVDGDADGTLVFRHADGTIYGGAPLAKAQEQLSEAFLGLRSMGWKERETRQALDTVRPHVGADEPVEGKLETRGVRLREGWAQLRATSRCCLRRRRGGISPAKPMGRGGSAGARRRRRRG
jgi:hypothetical protein